MKREFMTKRQKIMWWFAIPLFPFALIYYSIKVIWQELLKYTISDFKEWWNLRPWKFK